MNCSTSQRRHGFSLLELLVAMALMASMVTAVSVLLRVNYDHWLDYRSDSMRQESATGVLRHLVREVRQAEQVVAVTPSSSSSGSLSLRMPTGQVVVWDHNGTNVRYGVNTATQLLGNHITGLTFAGLHKDGVTPATDPEDVQSVRITVAYTLPDRTPAARSLTTVAWIRAF